MLWECLLVVNFYEYFLSSDSLSCIQCSSSTEDCSTDKTDCENDEFISCVESSVNSTLGECLYLWNVWDVRAKETRYKEDPELELDCAARLAGRKDDSPVAEVSRSCMAIQAQNQTSG